MCNDIRIKNYDIVTIPLSAGVGKYSFEKNQTISNAKKILSLRAYYAYVDGMTDEDGKALVDAQTFRSGFVTLSDRNNKERISHLPLTEIAMMPNTQNPAEFLILEVDGLNPSKCEVIFGDPSAIVDGMVIVIGFVYEATS